MALVIKEVSSNTVTEVGNVIIIEGGGLTPDQSTKIDNLPSDTITSLSTKVDKVTGKGLSTNDYDDTEQTKVTNATSHISNVSNPHSVSKSDVGLSNVDNTSDADKPVSTAQQAAIDLKANISDIPDVENTNYLGGWNANTNTPAISDATGSNAQFYIVDVSGTQDLGSGNVSFVEGGKAYHNGTVWQAKDPIDAVASVAGKTGVITLVKDDVGLSNVDNTSDANKPVSTAQQTALNLKANIASPSFTGTVTGISATMVGLGNVNNTSDLNKPISTATQTALDGKANTDALLSGFTADSNAVKITAAEKASYLTSAVIDGLADAISVTGTHTETTTAIDFSTVQGKSITLTSNRSYTISGLSASNPIGILQITHAGFTPSFSGVTSLDSALDKSGVYYLKFTRQPDGTITQSNQSGGGSVTTQEIVDSINAVTTDAERLDYDNLKNLPVISTGQSVSTVIENTDVLTLNATPIVLKETPGADKIDYVNECFAYVKFNTTAYDTNTTLNLKSGTTIIGTCNILGATNNTLKLFTMNGNSPLPNSALTIQTATGEATNGDSHVGIVAGLVQRDIADWTFTAYATAPGAPTALSATVNSNEIDIDLSWTAPASDGGSAITGYKIERDTDGGGYSTIVADTGTTDVTYTDEDPGNGTQSYRVSAINSVTTGDASTADSAVINITYNINSDYLAEQPWTDPTIPNGHSLINGPQDATSLLDEVAAGMRFKTLNAKDMQVANSGDDSAIQNNYSYKTLIEIDSIAEGGAQLVTDGTSGSAHTTPGRKFETIQTGASRGDVRIRKAGSVDADVVISKLKVWGGTPIPQAFEILIDVGATTTGVDSNGDQWDNMTTFASGTTKSNIVDTNNNATGIDLVIVQDLADGAGTMGASGVNSAGGGWPSSVWSDYHSGGATAAADGQARWENLPSGYTYDIHITGSRDVSAGDLNRRLRIGADASFSVTDWYDAASNTDPNEAAILTGLTPDGSGNLTFYYSAYSTSDFCYIGVIRLIATPV